MAVVVLSLVLSIATFGIVLTILFRDKRSYASRGDLNRLSDHVTAELGRLQHSQSQLYRYTEAVDAQSGGHAYQVLRRRVRRDNSQAGER